VILSHFPLLPNGKIDRKALPRPEFTEERCGIAPETTTEKSLAKIWCEILKIPHVSKQSHFFQLGGHSLLATQLISRISRQIGVKLPLRALFNSPTLEKLALEIDKAKKNSTSAIQFPEIVTASDQRYEEFPLTDVQHAYWLGRSGVYALGDVSVHVYSEYDCPNLNILKLENAWNKVIERHEALRLVFTQSGTQKILPHVPKYEIETIDLSGLEAEAVTKQLEIIRHRHSHEVFPADRWPLFSLKAAKLKNNAVHLYISFDSLIIDGWSVDIIFEDLVKFYENESAYSKPLTLSFRDYVLHSKSLRDHPSYIADKNYWLDRLKEFPKGPPLPLLKSSKEIKKQKFSRCKSRLSKAFWSDLQSIITKQKLSPTGLLTAIFAEILEFFSNSNHFTINLTLFDRIPLHPEINEIAGDFTSLTLLEVDYREKPRSFKERAMRVQEQLWQDLDHHLYSGVEFSREIAKTYSGSSDNPLFPVVFTSVLGLDNKQNEDILRILGDEVYSITQTPQVWLDFKAYEVNGDLIIENHAQRVLCLTRNFG
jgi:acyl carrier protein